MVQAFAILLMCQLAGEGVVHATGVPVPGPVIGLVLLAIGLVWRERSRPAVVDAPLSRAANGLLGHLSLLFVPAAVGIVQQGAVLARSGATIAVVLVASTVLTLAVTAGVFVWALRFVEKPRVQPAAAP